MFDKVKTLILNLFYLGLILSAHLGLLSLTFGYDWIKQFYFGYSTTLLGSVLSLAIIYIFSFYYDHKFCNILRDKWLYLLAIIGIGALIYAVFWKDLLTQKIYVSTLAFMAVTIAISSSAHKKSITWKTLRYATIAGLLGFNLNLLYEYQNLVFNLKNPLNVSVVTKLKKDEETIQTSFYSVHKTVYYFTDYYIPARLSNIPSHIAALNNKEFLLIDRFGNISYLSLQQQNEEDLYIKKLNAIFPINYRELFASPVGGKIVKSMFRINGLHIDTENKKKVLYVSHHHWNKEKACITLRLSKLDDLSVLFKDDAVPQWQTLYDTKPCFPVAIKDKEVFGGGHQAGGKIVSLDKDHVLFSVGDHAFDLFKTKYNFPQDKNVSYGKIWKIHRETGAAELISLGHRNPQGLYYDRDGSIWETEHGPASGDELNKIERGKNYGWPYVLYGTDYGRMVWPLNKKQDNHEGYEPPIFAWNPAIAVSDLLRVEQNLFPSWEKDLLVGSLRKRTLYRLQMDNDRVVYSEPIYLGQRIRNLFETPNGEIFIWSDRQNLIRLRPADSVPRKNETLMQAGKRLSYKCTSCHSMAASAGHHIGPNLFGVYNESIARHDDYNYSPALKNKTDARWTSKNLNLFLRNPEAFAPGTSMQIRVSDENERNALIHFLKEAK